MSESHSEKPAASMAVGGKCAHREGVICPNVATCGWGEGRVRQPYCSANLAAEAMIRELTDRHDANRVDPLAAWEEATTPVFLWGDIGAYVRDHRTWRRGQW